MYKKNHMSGLRTIYFPKFDNKEDTITLKFVFSTPIIFEKKQTNIVKDIYHTFSPFHLIEHTLIHQNESSFNELDQKYNATLTSAFTSQNITYFILNIKDKKYIKEALSTILKNLMNQNEINKESLMHELEIIKHEFQDDYLEIDEDTIIKNINDFIENNDNNKKTKIKKTEINLINKIVSNLEDDKKITKYYKKHYTPQNTIVTIEGADKNIYNEICLIIDDFFVNYPQKEPNTYDYSEEILSEELTNCLFEKNDEFYDNLFSKKYYIFPLKDRKKTYCETRVYLKIPKNKKIVMATKLLFSIAYKEIGTSQILLQDLRQKEKLVYSITPQIDILENSNKYALSLSFKTESKNVKTALTALRNTLNVMANGNSIPVNEFNRIKNSFAKEYYQNVKDLFSDDDFFEDLVCLCYSNKKFLNFEKEMKILKDLKLEDVVNVANFISKTNQFTIQCFGNDIKFEDLKKFSNIKNLLSINDLNKHFGGSEKIEKFNNEKTYDAKTEDDDDVPVITY